jgi:hypothetical protein
MYIFQLCKLQRYKHMCTLCCIKLLCVYTAVLSPHVAFPETCCDCGPALAEWVCALSSSYILPHCLSCWWHILGRARHPPTPFRGHAGATGRQFTAPLALRPERDASGRYDLSVVLADGGGGRVHPKNHRVVGLSLLRTAVSRTGRALAAPQFVVPAHVGDLEVDHKDWDPLDCRVCNLVLSPSSLHRSAGRFGWELRSLPHSVRGRPRATRAWKKWVARRPAAWRQGEVSTDTVLFCFPK